MAQASYLNSSEHEPRGLTGSRNLPTFFQSNRQNGIVTFEGKCLMISISIPAFAGCGSTGGW